MQQSLKLKREEYKLTKNGISQVHREFLVIFGYNGAEMIDIPRGSTWCITFSRSILMKALGKLKKEPGIWLHDAAMPVVDHNDVMIKIAVCIKELSIPINPASKQKT